MTNNECGMQPQLLLPAAPPSETGPVKAWEQPVEMLSFLPEAADLNPMFLEKRVYQGSSGDVYPLPFIDRIAANPVLRSWRAIHIENRYLRLMVMPEIGGRIHVGMDKVNGYDFFYRQNVIKPALVGLAGPWISGGVEFNWPQHHRPKTFMPVETEIERHADGSVTVWCSDYDRMSGMKGMHGICLHPDRALLELKVRIYNGTDALQTFLWWANASAKVHEDYQSFFPPDVRYVADHAKRAVSSFPLAGGTYYGIDYGLRAEKGIPLEQVPRRFKPHGYPPNDLSRYANIPVPTGYMIVQTEGDFFGGYDHAADAGFVHVASHHIAPGKKQWTWGNHEFGYAWDRNLTEADGPYVELMAGVYTDNQPDFSFLAPGETKAFSQFWYPLRKTGIPLASNLDVSIRLEAREGAARISLCVTRDQSTATIVLRSGTDELARWETPVTVESGFSAAVPLPEGIDPATLSVSFSSDTGRSLDFSLAEGPAQAAPPTAVEPPLPQQVGSADELFLIGVHLDQYRHATRSPEPYWREALRRDPGDMRCNHALAKLHLKRGQYVLAEAHLRCALGRATWLNSNPQDGEISYTLGLTLRLLHRSSEAYAAFYKATWNAAWRSAAYHELAKTDVARGDLDAALEHLRLSLNTNTENLNARNLCVAVLRKLGQKDAAAELLAQTRALDPLDIWSRFQDGAALPCHGHQILALGLLLVASGLNEDAIRALESADTSIVDGSSPLIHMALARCFDDIGDEAQAEKHMRMAAEAPSAYCFPNGNEQLAVLQYATAKSPGTARFHSYLGNLLFHQTRHEEAIEAWEVATGLDGSLAQAWRNLGIAYFNVRHDAEEARRAFDLAFASSPADGRIFYERDQLQKRLNVGPAVRLAELLLHHALVEQRDDLAVELATLYNQRNRPAEALDVLLGRQFRPWEGGEGLVLAQFTAAHVKLGRANLAEGNAAAAREHFAAALNPPESLGEARHVLANCSHIYYWLGRAMAACGEFDHAAKMYERAVGQPGDFQRVSVQPFSEMTYWSGLALDRVGRSGEAKDLFHKLLHYAVDLESKTAKIDYFATSLPDLLLFEDDLGERRRTHARLLRASALIGLGKSVEGRQLIEFVLDTDPNNLAAGIYFLKPRHYRTFRVRSSDGPHTNFSVHGR
jgi:tetratricopeptide (TPR) repeat protein